MYLDPFDVPSRESVRLFDKPEKKEEESQPLATMNRSAFLQLFRADAKLYRERLTAAKEVYQQICAEWDKTQERVRFEVEQAKRRLQAEYQALVEAETKAYYAEPRTWWQRLRMVKDCRKVRYIVLERLQTKGSYDPDLEVVLKRGPSYLIPANFPKYPRYWELEKEITDRQLSVWGEKYPQGRHWLEQIGYFEKDLILESAQWEAIHQLVEELDSHMFSGQLAYQVLQEDVRSVDTVSVPTWLLNPPPVKDMYEWLLSGGATPAS